MHTDVRDLEGVFVFDYLHLLLLLLLQVSYLLFPSHENAAHLHKLPLPISRGRMQLPIQEMINGKLVIHSKISAAVAEVQHLSTKEYEQQNQRSHDTPAVFLSLVLLKALEDSAAESGCCRAPPVYAGGSNGHRDVQIVLNVRCDLVD